MSYNNIKTEINLRFAEVGKLLAFIDREETLLVAPAILPMEIKVIKGLFYVHLYSAVEFSVNKLVQNTLILIKQMNIRNNDYILRFNTISSNNHLRSFKDCGYSQFHNKSNKLFLEAESASVSAINETVFSSMLQNIWVKTIHEIIDVFGMTPFVVSTKNSIIIDEVVDNRNKVAHGRETAEVVGSMPNYTDLKQKFDAIYEVIALLIIHFESYFTAKEFLKVTSRAAY
ncbi:MAG: MAE_28990/MAE_18760 family HEPN-like nuclease [Bacteroidota bacterium]